MKTSANIARVSAKCILAAVSDLSVASVPSLDKNAREMRYNALQTLRETARSLEEYAVAFEAPDGGAR